MAKTPTIRSPRLAVVLGDPADPASWTSVDVQSIGADMVRTEEHMTRRKKPSDQYPILSQQVLGYYALHRTGVLPADVTYDQFATECVEVAAVDTEEVGPTPEGPSAD